MGIARSVSKRVVGSKVAQAAPGFAQGFVHEALKHAINGAGPLPPARETAAKKLADADGNVDKAVRSVIDRHVGYAGLEGFVTNLGGLVTAAATIPANVTGLAVIQARMISVIAALRGYDLDDPRVRNAILLCMLGEDPVKKLVKQKEVPGPPMALATAPVHDPELSRHVATLVASELIAQVGGKRLATTVGRRVPVFGGFVGLTVDGWSTWRVGRYAGRELLPRARR